jgi:alkyl sulfatase BDS1-like metallo-beta-lactamase superfamily hydrolase
MDLFDTLLTARGAIAQWIYANPFDPKNPESNARRQKMTDAEEELSEALLTIEDMDLDAALKNLEADAQTLRDDAAKIAGVASSIQDVVSVSSAVDSIVAIVKKVAGAV